MSVPLDRLYDFLQTLCNHDVLIYRYLPHGSRKIADCKPLAKTAIATKVDRMFMVCHDQEPLDFREFEPCLPHKPEQRKIFPVLQSIVHMYGSLYDKVLLCHSEQRSEDLAWFERHGSVGIYYWSHALIARDWYRYAELDSKLLNCTPHKDFLIYNRAWSGLREYRIKFTEELLAAGLDSNCKITFNPIDNGCHYNSHKFSNTQFTPSQYNFEQRLLPTTAPASASADYDADDYCGHRIETVLETVFDSTKWHLTEKTLRPIACAKPFILAATPHSLEYLRSYGFRTYHTVWDESYDLISDPVKRIRAIVALMTKIANMTPRDKERMDAQCAEIAAFNQRRFFSQEFYQQVVGEFKTNFDYAVKHAQAHTEVLRNYIKAV